MRGIISLLVVALIGLGTYFYFLKSAAPAPGATVTQAISTTGVEMDLNSIAQAERGYFAQNGSYADLDRLTAAGALTTTRSGRDGYAYAIQTSAQGFTVTARHADTPATPGGATPLATPPATPPHYPAFSIDQSMQIRQSD